MVEPEPLKISWLGLVLLVPLLYWLGRRLFVAWTTWRALALAPALARRLSWWVRPNDYDDEAFLRADGAGEPWVDRRREALARLAATLSHQNSESVAWSVSLRDRFSDLRFTDANRVPFPFARVMRSKFNVASVVTESQGAYLLDLSRSSI